MATQTRRKCSQASNAEEIVVAACHERFKSKNGINAPSTNQNHSGKLVCRLCKKRGNMDGKNAS